MSTSDRQHRYGMGRIHQRGNVWWMRYSRNGEAFDESSRSENETDAKKLLKKRMGEIALERFYYTGWRTSELLTLQWRQIDLAAAEVRLDPGSTKNGDGRVIYLDGEVLDVMKEQRAFVLSLQRTHGEIIPWVFVNPEEGARIRNFRKSWDNACQATGLTGKLFHDFRRTSVRNMVRAGVPEVVAMRISGHKTRSVFDRYNVVSEHDLRDAARRVSTPPAKDRDKTGTIVPSAPQTVSGKTA